PEPEGPVIRDKRRIDPLTGQVRESQETRGPDTGDAAVEPPVQQSSSTDLATSEIEDALAERTADLQRLQAEYVNYKRRVDRDRQASRELVIGSVLTELLGILDDIGRAREAGELEGAFKAVAESLERVTEKLGLVRYGEQGDAF